MTEDLSERMRALESRVDSHETRLGMLEPRTRTMEASLERQSSMLLRVQLEVHQRHKRIEEQLEEIAAAQQETLMAVRAMLAPTVIR